MPVGSLESVYGSQAGWYSSARIERIRWKKSLFKMWAWQPNFTEAQLGQKCPTLQNDKNLVSFSVKTPGLNAKPLEVSGGDACVVNGMLA
jgi:hypothetical protein